MKRSQVFSDALTDAALLSIAALVTPYDRPDVSTFRKFLFGLLIALLSIRALARIVRHLLASIAE